MGKWSTFSEREEQTQARFRDSRDRVLQPLVRPLARLKISPDAISLFGVLCLVPAVWLFGTLPIVSVACLAVYVLVDALDGPYARLVNRAGPRGELVDVLCDQAGPVVIVLLLLAHGAAPPLLAAAYLALYLTLIAMVMLQNASDIPVQPIFRSRFWLFAAAALLGIFQVNWVGHLMLVCCIQMVAFCLWCLGRIRRWLPEKADAALPQPPRRPSARNELITFWLITLLPLAVLPWAEPILAWLAKPV